MSTSYAVDDGALVDLAVGLARTPSVSGQEEAAIRLAAAAMAAAGFDTVTIDRAGNAVGCIGPTGGSTIMFDGHIDSIPLHSKSQWTVDPFGGTIEDDTLYGLGICDQKASIAAAIWGVAEPAPAGRGGGQRLRRGDGGRRAGGADCRHVPGLLRDE
jgi:acetylornithine deacetylase/succinyl-diaminopimelate desuccinylase-like protein